MLTLHTPYFPEDFDKALKGSRKSKYRGKLLLPGEDAAIVVTPDTLHVFLDAQPVPMGHALAAKVTDFEEEIR